MRVALTIAALLVAQPAAANPLQQFKQWLWPHHRPAETVPLPPARPSVAPPIAKPAVIVPPVVSKPAAASPKPQPKPQPKPVAKPVREKPAAARPSSTMCAQIGMGIRKIGREGVRQEARRRGYSDAQINGAARACGY